MCPSCEHEIKTQDERQLRRGGGSCYLLVMKKTRVPPAAIAQQGTTCAGVTPRKAAQKASTQQLHSSCHLLVMAAAAHYHTQNQTRETATLNAHKHHPQRPQVGNYQRLWPINLEQARETATPRKQTQTHDPPLAPLGSEVLDDDPGGHGSNVATQGQGVEM